VGAVGEVGSVGVVGGWYLVVVLGLGREPTADERSLLGLSMLAAAVAALLWVPARERLTDFATRRVYGERRNARLAALDRYAPPGVRWTKPAGGLFLWATLPEGFDTVKLLDDAIAEKVAFVPGAAFYPTGGGERTMRLNFSYAAPDVIDEGIQRLCRVIEKGAERLGRPWQRSAPPPA